MWLNWGNLSCSQGDEIAEPESISKKMEETVFAGEGDYCLCSFLIIRLSTPSPLPQPKEKRSNQKSIICCVKKCGWMSHSLYITF